MPVLKLAKDEAVKLYGPMSVLVNNGCIDVHGKVVCEGARFVIHKARNYVILALSNTELDVTMINESQIQSLEANDPYIDKRRLIQEIVKTGAKKIVVVGCVDCGKTSSVTMIYNTFLSSGFKPVAIDADVGQSDIGPPGFISMGSSEKPVYWINELKPIAMRFIGDIKPQGYTQLIIHEVSRLVEMAQRSGFDSFVIDTDGWVRDEYGIQHKYLLIEAVKPDVVIVLGGELRGYFSHLSKVGVLVKEFNEPTYRKMRSREERRLLRSFRYREFFENSSVLKVKMDNVLVHGCYLFYGSTVDPLSIANLVEGKVVYVSRLPGLLNIYGYVKSHQSEDLKKMGFEKIRIYPQGFEKGIYCAVGLVNGPEYPCIIEKFDFESREIVLRTNYSGRIEVLKLSRIKLTQEYMEEYLEV